MHPLLTVGSVIAALVIGCILGWTIANAAISPSPLFHLLVLR